MARSIRTLVKLKPFNCPLVNPFVFFYVNLFVRFFVGSLLSFVFLFQKFQLKQNSIYLKMAVLDSVNSLINLCSSKKIVSQTN